MENFNGKMLREIAHDRVTPKKSDSKVATDLFERLKDEDEDINCNEIESYEVFAEYR